MPRKNAPQTETAASLTSKSGGLKGASDQRDYKTLVDHSALGVLMLEGDHPVYVNSSFLNLFGIPADTAPQQLPPLKDLLNSEDGPHLFSRLSLSESAQSRGALEVRGRRLDGREFWIHCIINPLPDLGQRAFCLTFMDISAKRANELEVRDNEAKFKELVEHALEGVLVLREGVVVFANRGIAAALGYSSGADMVGKPLTELVVPKDREVIQRLIQEFPSQGEFGAKSQINLLHRKGRTVHIQTRARSFIWEGAPAIQWSLRDVSEIEKTRRELEILAEAVNQAGDLIFITDAQGRIEYVNPAFERITGYTRHEVMGETPRLLNSKRKPSEYYAHMWAQIKNGTVWVGHHANRRKDGSVFEVDAVHSPIKNEEGQITHYIAVHHDITERVNLEAQLRQSQKMDALGQLASGLAHEFNNLLQVMRGYSELALREAHENSKLKKHLENIQNSVGKASVLTRHLLTFTNRQGVALKLQDVNTLLEDMEPMLRPLVGEHVDLELNLERPLPEVMLESVLMEQLVLNLCMNARDAMPKGGELVIQTKAKEPDPDLANRHPRLLGFHTIQLTVRDSGVGVPAHLAEHIFNPFFTTKAPGKGTGLGLSTAYGIVELHGGAIECSSEEGHGAEFRVYLPLPVDNVVREPSQKRPIQTILLAEDDPGVREFVAQLLAEDGYKVLVAQDGVEAVTLFNSKSQDVDLALLDVLMPRMTGPEAFKIMREKNPNLRVIFSSGHIMDSKELLSGELEKCPLLRKPFFQEELRKAIFAAST